MWQSAIDDEQLEKNSILDHVRDSFIQKIMILTLDLLQDYQQTWYLNLCYISKDMVL